MRPLIVIMTDFGTSDPYVGIMKGVLNQIAPQVPIVDLSNEIPPGDVRRAAVILWQSKPYFPPGSIFLAVVDPGVGTERRPIILTTQNHTLIGPDNGLFTFILDDSNQAWELKNPNLALPNPSSTFHGRDIFAPAAGYAVKGVQGPDFGPRVRNLNTIAPPLLDSPAPNILRGEILFSDRFGNLLTSLGQFQLQGNDELTLIPWVGNLPEMSYARNSQLVLPDKRVLPLVTTFADLPNGKCGVLIGSSGLLEIVANRQRAVDILGIQPGQTVTLRDVPHTKQE
ncbi:MAG: SAM-dependent chlorinase/fluorinase [Anaerolineales bacterium]|jgi:S-adenosylmethionine hydrolase